MMIKPGLSSSLCSAYINSKNNLLFFASNYISRYTHTHTHTHTSFQTFFVQKFKNWCRFLKIQYVIAIHLMRWRASFYDSRFKWTATAAIGIHPIKDWLSQLVNFKNAIRAYGHFHHHHHIVLAARISLTLSRHSSLSFIALGRSSGQQPVPARTYIQQLCEDTGCCPEEDGHFRRTIYNKIIFLKCPWMLWNASDCFLTLLHESSIRVWVA